MPADPDPPHDERPSPTDGGSASLEETVGTPGRALADDGTPLAPGDNVGRYVVLARLGAGAMGVVLSAYDPELDRKVALKLLRLRRGNRPEAQARLQREAQALARLSHPNVVAVHDVGIHDGRVFLAMEYVEGETAREWRLRTRPGVKEALEMFLQAGRGLAAAHREGLVHRDFKPDNMMVGKRGRVWVMDFGLARVGTELTGESEELDPVELSTSDALATPLTQTGSILGTPAYMPPEQLAGDSPDARSDQFSFCVALYEALYGERPFGGENMTALAVAITEGRVREAPRKTTVPTWLRNVVLRGLAPRPDDRWPSMEALLAQLSHDPAARRRRFLTATISVAVVGGALYGVQQASSAQAQVCAGMQEHLTGVWDEAARTTVRDAIVGTGFGSADDVARRTAEQLDAYTGEWVRTRERACEATRVRAEQSEALMDLRMGCLDGRLRAVRALVEVLSSPDAEVFENAITVASSLPTLEACSDVEGLQATVAPPTDPAVRERVEALRKDLALAVALRESGKPQGGLELARAASKVAHEIDVPEMNALAALELGRALHEAGEHELAETELRSAYFGAVELGLSDLAADAAAQLASTVGVSLTKFAPGRVWAEHARAQAEHARDPLRIATAVQRMGVLDREQDDFQPARENHELAVNLLESVVGTEDARLVPALTALSSTVTESGTADEALAIQQRALAIARATLGPDHPRTAEAQGQLGARLNGAGKYAEARNEIEAALAILERTYGPEHGKVTAFLNKLAETCLRLQDTECSERNYLRALAIDRKVEGSDSPTVARQLIGVSGMYRSIGKNAEAIAALEEALPIMERTYGPQHQNLARVLVNLGLLHSDMENIDEARLYLDRALPVVENALGPDHPNLALVLGNVAMVDTKQGLFDVAIARYERALAIRTKALGADHPLLGFTHAGLGHTLLEVRRFPDAIEHLERALELSGKTSGPAHVGAVRFSLAKALWQVSKRDGRDRDRARELAHTAREDYGRGKGDYDVAEITQWLATH